MYAIKKISTKLITNKPAEDNKLVETKLIDTKSNFLYLRNQMPKFEISEVYAIAGFKDLRFRNLKFVASNYCLLS